MQQLPNPGYDGLQAALAPLSRQLERLDDRMRNDLDGLRKEIRDLVTQKELVPQIEDMKNRIKALEEEQLSRRELLALRLAGFGGAIAALVAVIDLLNRFKP